MAYQNVSTPRFYIDHGLWLYTIRGSMIDSFSRPFIHLNPTNPILRSWEHINIPRVAPINYIAFLGSSDSQNGFYPRWNKAGADYGITGFQEIINCKGYNGDPEEFDGFSMGTFDDDPSAEYALGWMTSSAKCGAISIGSTYDMPNAPNLSLTLSREYGGTKELTTHNGGSISNTMWNSAPKWGNLGAWELSDGTGASPALSRSGRRTWDLEFSFIDDGNLWGANQSLSKYVESSAGINFGDTVQIPTGSGDQLITSSLDDVYLESEEYPATMSNEDHNRFDATLASGTPIPGSGRFLTDTFPIVEGETYQLSFKVKVTSGSLNSANSLHRQEVPGCTFSTGNQVVKAWWYEDEVYDALEAGQQVTIESTWGANETRNTYVDLFTMSSVGIETDIEVRDISLRKSYRTSFTGNILTDENFFSQVWHKTLGGTLPFIFQPDGGTNGNNNPDQFAICKFKNNSLKATQSAFNVYDISLKIEEVW